MSAEVRNGSLVSVSIRNDGEPLVRPLAVIHRKHRALSLVGTRFLKRLLEETGAAGQPTARLPEVGPAAARAAVVAETLPIKPPASAEANGRAM